MESIVVDLVKIIQMNNISRNSKLIKRKQKEDKKRWKLEIPMREITDYLKGLGLKR